MDFWAFVGFGLLGLGLYLLQRLTRKTLNVKANDLVLHYKKPPLVDSHQEVSFAKGLVVSFGFSLDVLPSLL